MEAMKAGGGWPTATKSYHLGCQDVNHTAITYLQKVYIAPPLAKYCKGTSPTDYTG